MPAAIRTLALVVNAQKTGAPDLARTLLAIAQESGAATRITETFPAPDAFLKNCDACCVIGGDGTLLGIAAAAAREQVPVIGVNRGNLGFLTTFTADEARADFPGLLAGNYQLSHRSLLQCQIGPTAAPSPSALQPFSPSTLRVSVPLTLLALNDIVIKAERNSHLVRLEVLADGEYVTDYFSDGLIFSTPTGSTAYNLSAGGPLIHPGAEVIAMTPVSPHTLSNRSIIFRHNVRLQIRNRDAQARLLVSADGQQNPVLCGDAPLEITLSQHRLPLIQRPGHSHFSIVRQKLKWSGSH